MKLTDLRIAPYQTTPVHRSSVNGGKHLLRSKGQSEVQDREDRWLITYADMITLIMVFFVVMYAIAEVKVTKLTPISYALNKNFSSSKNNDTIVFSEGEFSDIRKYIVGDKIVNILKSNLEDLGKPPNPAVKQLGNNISSKLNEKNMKNMVNMEFKPDELTISLNTGKGFFERGSADINPITAQVLDTVADSCRDLPDSANIRVEGYTCDLPITSGNFPSNWELSTARATNVARYFIEKDNIDPWKLSASGYGEYHPKYPNTSEANRSLNRRVDITIVFKEK